MDEKTNIIKCIKTVYKKAENSELMPSIFSELKLELRFLSKQLKLTQKQSFFFSIIFCECTSRQSIDRNRIISHVRCDAVDFIDFERDIEMLFDKGYVHRITNKRIQHQYINSEDFKVRKHIQQAILSGENLNSVREIKLSNAVDFVNYIYALMKEVENEDLNFNDVLKEVAVNIHRNRGINFIDVLLKSQLSTEDICILLYYIGAYRLGGKDKCIKGLSIDLYGENGTSANLMQHMAAGYHILVKKNFLRNAENRRRDEFYFEITGDTKKLMREYGIIPDFETKVCQDAFDFLYTIETLFVQKDDEVLTSRELLLQVENFMNTNEDLTLVREVRQLGLKDVKHEAIFLKCLYDGATSSETSVDTVTESVHERKREAVWLKNEFVMESNELIKRDLVELGEASFFSNARLRLTNYSQHLLIECGLELPEKKRNNYSISPQQIKSKALYYNDEDATKMEMLKQILSDENFQCIQQRMAQKALPTGVIALLYGQPGTGKTESVYQFAKQNNREIIQVDISQSKSMWFGESEKQIKKIFTRYQQYAERCKLKPILLFNEADAVISKRKDASASNVAQTENAIQNILLEEFEKFTGICIATTNLVNNLDPAFERRFLYKIKLTRPNTETLAKIWKSKLSEAEGYDVSALAKNYPFSGGQIDNIVKKIEMHEILHGQKPTHNEIRSWCETERFQQKEHKRIGFIV